MRLPLSATVFLLRIALPPVRVVTCRPVTRHTLVSHDSFPTNVQHVLSELSHGSRGGGNPSEERILHVDWLAAPKLFTVVVTAEVCRLSEYGNHIAAWVACLRILTLPPPSAAKGIRGFGYGSREPPVAVGQLKLRWLH